MFCVYGKIAYTKDAELCEGNTRVIFNLPLNFKNLQVQLQYFTFDYVVHIALEVM